MFSVNTHLKLSGFERSGLQDLTGGLTDMASTCVRFRLAKKNGGIQ